MKTMLLTSQGLPEELKDVFLNILPKPPQDVKVSFITTAAYGEEENPIWIEEYRKQLQEFGITQIEDLDLKGKTKNELQTILTDKDIIFVNGGNTFYLLKYARESGFLDLVPDLLNQGKLYVGISAGSILAGPTIEIAGRDPEPDKNYINLQDLSSMNLVPFTILPHYKPEHKSYLENYAKTISYPLIAITDTQAVLVQDSNYRLVGVGEKIVHNGQFLELYTSKKN